MILGPLDPLRAKQCEHAVCVSLCECLCVCVYLHIYHSVCVNLSIFCCLPQHLKADVGGIRNRSARGQSPQMSQNTPYQGTSSGRRGSPHSLGGVFKNSPRPSQSSACDLRAALPSSPYLCCWASTMFKGTPPHTHQGNPSRMGHPRPVCSLTSG